MTAPPRLTPIAQAAATLLACCATSLVHAQAFDEAAQPAQLAVIEGERLSQWVIRQNLQHADSTALHWRVPAERLAQRQLRDNLLHQLQPLGVPAALREAIHAIQPTGRLPLAAPSPQALVGIPGLDPVLAPDHSIHLFPRPTRITMVASDGHVCQLPHVPTAYAVDYLHACDPTLAPGVDHVWAVQPDGSVAQWGIAQWNRTTQTHLAPGAWLWVPLRSQHVPAEVSGNVARLLATLPPLEHQHPTPLAQLARQVAAPLTPTSAAPASSWISASDWGEIGLLQTPSARMAPEGAARFHVSKVSPYTRGTVMFQPLDWLEAGFRYTDVFNRLYGPENFSGNQSYKDKSIDIKLRLSKESAYFPEVAIGVRDMGGTGLFSAEYIVANKRWGKFDASVGLGWGYLGSRADIKNPFVKLFGQNWASRPGRTVNDQGGNLGLSSMFKGPTALFGGLQYAASDRLLLKAEADGNSYQAEPQGNNQPVRSRINFGLTYRQTPHVDWSVGIERGNKLMLGLTLQTDAKGLGGLWAPKPADPLLPDITPLGAVSSLDVPLLDILREVSRFTGWQARVVNVDHDTVTFVIDAATTVFMQERIDKAVQYLNANLPSQYRRLVFQFREVTMHMATVEVDRAEWLGTRFERRAPSARLPVTRISQGNLGYRSFSDLDVRYDAYRWHIGPSFRNILGGPDGFLLFSAGLQLQVDYRLNAKTWLSGNLNARLIDNFNKFRQGGDSQMPRVRTLQREYTLSSRATLPNLQLNHVADLGNNQHVMVYGGLLESMFGGVGAEWFYRPWASRIALGIDVNHVRQRGFKQDFSFRNYSVNTGHATVYWDTGIQDIHAEISAGQYLAGDRGITLSINRQFDNGVALGAWATKTNVSAATFGEGSFDKGIYLSIPFDAMLPRSTPGSNTFSWQPITRDGGAKLDRRYTLAGITSLRSASAWQHIWPGRESDDTFVNFSQTQWPATPHPLSNIGQTTRALGAQVAAVPTSSWLVAGGAVLASSLLDKRADRWALSHSTGTWETAGNLTSAVPFLLAGGAGALYLGLAGADHTATAETSIRAAGYTLASNLALKYAVGRARPSANVSPTQFNGFNGKAFNSSFASVHTSVAFALVTPFAQQYNQPWLYGLAATTALGRIQKRDHWVSDTVGGALLGSAIGSMLSGQQTATGNPVSIQATPNAVLANWKY